MRERITLGMPSGNFTPATCEMARHRLMHLEGSPLLWNERSYSLTKNRNACLAVAREYGASHILWLDADVLIPPYTLRVLLAHDQPIVGATYARRSHKIEQLTETLGELYDPREPRRTGLVRMRRLPFGCCLMRLEVLALLPDPVFRMGYVDGIEVGEDWHFCDQLCERVPFWCDCDLSRQLSHVIEVEAPTPPNLWPLVTE